MAAPDTPEHLGALLDAVTGTSGHLHICLTCKGSESIIVALHHLAWRQGEENPYAAEARGLLEDFADRLGIPHA